jgi:hypothetical protein
MTTSGKALLFSAIGLIVVIVLVGILRKKPDETFFKEWSTPPEATQYELMECTSEASGVICVSEHISCFVNNKGMVCAFDPKPRAQ